MLSPRTQGTNDWLGSVVLPIGELNATNDEARWYPLVRDSAHVKNEYGQKGKDPQGEIKLQCQFLNTVWCNAMRYVMMYQKSAPSILY